MGLALNKGKAKYTFLINKDMRRISSLITTNDCTFDLMNKFVYLVFAVTSRNNVSLAYRYYYDLKSVSSYIPNGHVKLRGLDILVIRINYLDRN